MRRAALVICHTILPEPAATATSFNSAWQEALSATVPAPPTRRRPIRRPLRHGIACHCSRGVRQQASRPINFAMLHWCAWHGGGTWNMGCRRLAASRTARCAGRSARLG